MDVFGVATGNAQLAWTRPMISTGFQSDFGFVRPPLSSAIISPVAADVHSPPCHRGTALQLPVYALAAGELILAGRDAAPLQAGYWYVGGDGFKPRQAGDGR